MGIKINAIISSIIGSLTFCIYPFIAVLTFLVLPIVFSCLLKVRGGNDDF